MLASTDVKRWDMQFPFNMRSPANRKTHHSRPQLFLKQFGQILPAKTLIHRWIRFKGQILTLPLFKDNLISYLAELESWLRQIK